MSRQFYDWIIVYDDGSTETVIADNPISAVENAIRDWYYEGMRAVIRADYA